MSLDRILTPLAWHGMEYHGALHMQKLMIPPYLQGSDAGDAERLHEREHDREVSPWHIMLLPRERERACGHHGR